MGSFPQVAAVFLGEGETTLGTQRLAQPRYLSHTAPPEFFHS
jgi:hypothetical protein